MKVLHIELGRGQSGGGQQVAYLLPELRALGVDNVLACPPGTRLAGQMTEAGIRVIETPFRSDADLGIVPRLVATIRSERPDVVHLHSRTGAETQGGIAAMIAGVPAVLSRRVDERPRSTRLKYRMYARVICISTAIRDVLADCGVEPEKLRVVRSAVDAAVWQSPAPRAEFLAEFGLPEDAIVIGTIAQLIARKGHRVLLEALADGTARNVHALFFGSGDEATLRRAIAEAGLGSRVKLAGLRTDLPRWMGNLDLVVHPAFREGLGVSLLQAAAAGVPVVASRAGGIPEAVHHGVSGLLVPPGEPLPLRNAIAELLADGNLRRRMGAAGRAMAETEHSCAAMARGNLEVYRELAF